MGEGRLGTRNSSALNTEYIGKQYEVRDEKEVGSGWSD